MTGPPIDPRLELIVAMDPDGVIGRDNALPWHLPDDLRHFKQLTTGHAVVMGRKTHESIGRPLPNRRNLVLTRQPDWQAPGVAVYHDLDAALAAAGTGRIFIIGGAAVFQATLPRAAVLHRTRVHERHPGDVFFPDIGADWTVVWAQVHPADPQHACSFTLERMERRTDRAV